MILTLDLSKEKFESQIAMQKVKGELTSDEARWLTLAIKMFLGIKHEKPPLVGNKFFREFNARVPSLRLDGNLLEVSKVDGIVIVHHPKPKLAGRLNALA
ncbi:MAG: hypothetical protein Q7S86_02255 [bacterium]|nr:hypothetical protein [bacterium]